MNAEQIARILTDPIANELVDSPTLARLAYHGADGFPRVVPIGYLWDGSQFIMCTASNARKVRALARNSKVALTIDTDTQPPHVLLIRGTATVEIANGVPPEFLAASRKYIASDHWVAFEAQVHGTYDEMARIAVTPVWVKILDFETRIPTHS